MPARKRPRLRGNPEGSPPNFRRLLQTGRDSDFRIRCQEVEFKVHRKVLIDASAFFGVVCKETGFQENESGLLSLPEDQPGIVERALWYIYTGEYSPRLDHVVGLLRRSGASAATDSATLNISEDDQSNVRCQDLRIDVLVYQFADKVQLEDLRTCAARSFRNDFMDIQSAPRGFVGIMDLIFRSTRAGDRDLRRYVVEQCIKSYPLVLQDDELLNMLKLHEPLAWSLGLQLQRQAESLTSILQTSKWSTFKAIGAAEAQMVASRSSRQPRR